MQNYRPIYMGNQTMAGNNSWQTLTGLTTKNGAENAEVVMGKWP